MDNVKATIITIFTIKATHAHFLWWFHIYGNDLIASNWSGYTGGVLTEIPHNNFIRFDLISLH